VSAFRSEDYEAAWFRFWGLARSGDPESQFNLAQLYRLGRGIQRDMVQARRWYERAAERGYAPAQYQLGVLWERGDGVPPDPVEARSWYARAAGQGIEPARAALERLDMLGTGRARPLEDPAASAEPPARAAARPNPPAGPPRLPVPPKE
jgi:TPR repeat protein